MYKNILQKLFQIVEKENIVLAVYYGNRNGRDIDIFVIEKDGDYYRQCNIDNIDITIVGSEYFDYLFLMFDPLVTEPVLTGESIFGCHLNDLRKKLLFSEVEAKASEHLRKFAWQIFDAAKYFFKHNSCEESAINISFCFSYLCFANFYRKQKKVISFASLLALPENTLLQEVCRYQKKGIFQKDKTKYFLNILEKSFLK
jgi:hypothetical protein